MDQVAMRRMNFQHVEPGRVGAAGGLAPCLDQVGDLADGQLVRHGIVVTAR